jgi:hypothetical protein
MTYALIGEVRYENIIGDGYLELLNYYPSKSGVGEEAYFSRTLANSGEMGKISGTSTWRRFRLPFNRTGTSHSPTKLDLNLYLPGPGTVYLGKVQLVQYAAGWWSERASGWIGGFAGGIGGSLGSLLSLLAAKGRGRAFVIMATRILVGLGIVSTVLGVVALTSGQPYHVWFVLLLLGILLSGILIPRLRGYQKQYADLELRRMSSADAMGA